MTVTVHGLYFYQHYTRGGTESAKINNWSGSLQQSTENCHHDLSESGFKFEKKARKGLPAPCWREQLLATALNKFQQVPQDSCTKDGEWARRQENMSKEEYEQMCPQLGSENDFLAALRVIQVPSNPIEKERKQETSKERWNHQKTKRCHVGLTGEVLPSSRRCKAGASSNYSYWGLLVSPSLSFSFSD